MLSKEVKIEAATMYLQGVPPYKIRNEFDIKSLNIILNGLLILRNLVSIG